MATTISEEVVAYFTANTTGLVDGIDRAKKKVSELKKSYAERVNAVKGSILDPIGAGGSGLSKIGDSLASKLKLSATSVGLAAGAGALLVKTFQAADALAGRNADKMHEVNESLRQASKANLFASSVDGLDSLKAKYENTRSLIKDAEQTQREVDPYGFGGGLKGNALTAIANAQLSLKSAVGLGPYSNFDREQDEAAILKWRKRIAEKEAIKQRKLFGQEQKSQLGLTRTRLTGDSYDVRSAELGRGRRQELNGLKGGDLDTHDNRQAIMQRYREERRAAKEGQDFADRRFFRESSILGVQRSLVTEEQKRVRVAQITLSGLQEELTGRNYLTREARQTLQVDELRARNELTAAKTELSIAQSQHTLAQQTTSIHASNLSTTAKQYKAELANLSALQEQLAVVKDINASKAQGLGLSIEESKGHIKEMRQNELMGKSPSQIQKHLRDMQKDRRNRDRFDATMGRTDGLTNVTRDKDSNIIMGTDLITGERRVPSAGFVQSGTSLVSGHVGDRSTVGGGPSYITDLDPGGGLHSDGTTPAPFAESDAARFLRDAPSAEKALASWRGDPKHDPSARLAAMSPWDRPSRGGGSHTAAMHHAQNMVNQQIISNGRLLKIQQHLEKIEPLQ